MFGSIFISFFAATSISFLMDNLLPFTKEMPGSFLFLLLLFLLFFLFLTRPIVLYLETLAEGLMSIAKGKLDHRVPLTRNDELGVVAQNINYMAEQLEQMMEHERQIEKSKMELITNVSHDLRTPLTSIIGYLNLLQNDDYQDLAEHKRYIDNAFNKTQQLKKLIDDLFEYTRLTSGAPNLTFATIDLGGLLEQIIIEFEPLAAENSLTVKRVWEQRTILGHVDIEKFVRAIDNLLINALKFSLKPGEITVRLSERADHIYLAVENRGKPITEEQEQLLFERFYKAELSRNDNRMPPGAGLGLSITKNIVELHDGHLGLTHQNGHYTFYIELPRRE